MHVTVGTRGGDLLSALLKLTTYPSLCPHPLFDLQKRSASISEGQWVHTFCCMEQFTDTPLLRIHFHVRCHCVRLPLCCQQQNVTGYWWEDSAPAAMPSSSMSGVVGQQNKIGGITFGAAPLIFPSLLSLFI